MNLIHKIIFIIIIILYLYFFLKIFIFISIHYILLLKAIYFFLIFSFMLSSAKNLFGVIEFYFDYFGVFIINLFGFLQITIFVIGIAF